MHVKTQISLHLDNSHLNPEASANLAAHGLSIDVCKSTHKPHPRCNDSLFQGAIPKHEAITEIDLGFSFISGFFCLSFYLDCSKFTSVALLQNPVVKPETVPGLVQRLTRAGTAGLQLWPLCV